MPLSSRAKLLALRTRLDDLRLAKAAAGPVPVLAGQRCHDERRLQTPCVGRMELLLGRGSRLTASRTIP